MFGFDSRWLHKARTWSVGLRVVAVTTNTLKTGILNNPYEGIHLSVQPVTAGERYIESQSRLNTCETHNVDEGREPRK